MSDTKSLLKQAEECAREMMSTDSASQALGISIFIPEPGACEARMTVRRDMVNGHDICHGGLIFSLADSAFAFACNGHNEVAVAASASIEFLRPAKLGDELLAMANEVHKGRRLGLYDILVSDQDGQRVAVFRGRSALLGRPVLSSSERNDTENIE